MNTFPITVDGAPHRARYEGRDHTGRFARLALVDDAGRILSRCTVDPRLVTDGGTCYSGGVTYAVRRSDIRSA